MGGPAFERRDTVEPAPISTGRLDLSWFAVQSCLPVESSAGGTANVLSARVRASVLRRRGLLFPERVDLALEVLDALEALVDAGEPDVGDLVERVELVHRERPHP